MCVTGYNVNTDDHETSSKNKTINIHGLQVCKQQQLASGKLAFLAIRLGTLVYSNHYCYLGIM